MAGCPGTILFLVHEEPAQPVIAVEHLQPVEPADRLPKQVLAPVVVREGVHGGTARPEGPPVQVQHIGADGGGVLRGGHVQVDDPLGALLGAGHLTADGVGAQMLHTDGPIRPLLQLIGKVDGPDLSDPGGLDVVARCPVSERELGRGLCPLLLRLLGRLGQLCGAGPLPGLGQALEGQQGGGHTEGRRNAVEVPSRELWLLSSSFFSLFLLHVFPPFGD